MKKRGKNLFKKSSEGKYLKSIVYGGLDGIITTFAIVAGVTGASLSSGIALILGFANLIADGISMAVGDYLSTKSEKEFQKAEIKEEKEEIKTEPEKEKEEQIKYYLHGGMSRKEAEKVVTILMRHEKIFLKGHVSDELNFVENKNSPLKSSIATFFSFLILGLIPLLSYLLGLFFNNLIKFQFYLAMIFTLIALGILGFFKSKITGKNKFKSILETILIGGLTASAAYIIGELLAGFA